MSTTRITDNDYADVALYDKVNAIANEIDNELSKTVTTNTTQTITAKKTFTGDIVRNASLDGVGTRSLKTVDTNGKGSTSLVSYYTGEKIYNRLLAENTTSGKSAYLDVIAKDDGTAELQFTGSATSRYVSFNSATKVRVPTAGSSPENLEAVNIGYLNSKVANYFPLTGGTITGDLLRKIDIDSKVNPSTFREFVLLESKDKNGILNSSIRTGYRTDGTIDTIIYTGKDGSSKPFIFRMMADGTPVMLGQTPRISASGVEVPTASWVKSVLSSSGNGLATFSKGTNGYYKFANGLIIQWGVIEISTYNQTGTVTLPTAFSSGNYGLGSTGGRDGGNGQGGLSITDTKNATSFSYRSAASTSNFNNKHYWLAIGY